VRDDRNLNSTRGKLFRLPSQNYRGIVFRRRIAPGYSKSRHRAGAAPTCAQTNHTSFFVNPHTMKNYRHHRPTRLIKSDIRNAPIPDFSKNDASSLVAAS
jgi:hypothetical protein